MKVGDRVAVVGRHDQVQVGDVRKVVQQRVTVAITEQWVTEYRINDERELSEFPLTRLRGLATTKELKVSKESITPRKARWILERVAEGQARTFQQRVWPQVIRDNHRHRKDEPGMHVDNGNYANQLRHHDSNGIRKSSKGEPWCVARSVRAIRPWEVRLPGLRSSRDEAVGASMSGYCSMICVVPAFATRVG